MAYLEAQLDPVRREGRPRLRISGFQCSPPVTRIEMRRVCCQAQGEERGGCGCTRAEISNSSCGQVVPVAFARRIAMRIERSVRPTVWPHFSGQRDSAHHGGRRSIGGDDSKVIDNPTRQSGRGSVAGTRTKFNATPSTDRDDNPLCATQSRSSQ